MEVLKPRLYLETSIVSYLTARPSRDVVVLAHQDITRRWWERKLLAYQVFISAVVLVEARQGDRAAARKRMEVLKNFSGLPIDTRVEHLAAIFIRDLQIPEKAARDSLHIAAASVHGMEYLLTWNCKHIANGHIRRKIRQINEREGYPTPTICTPEELLDEND